MSRHLHFTKFILLSFAFHVLMIAAVYAIRSDRAPVPTSIPVDIVELPREPAKKTPPLRPLHRPSHPRAKPTVPKKPLPPRAVPKPKKFGTDDSVVLPRTSPETGVPEGAEQGKKTGKTGADQKPKQNGRLPFLSQNEIDQLARKGMPQKRPGDDSVTLDTDEFKFISYNRWLKIKVESILKYPELAAISGYQGTLYIQFEIMKDGSLGGFEVLKSSGYKILDDEAERSIRSAAPFQPLPPEWNMERYSIRAAVIFYLGTGYIR